MRTSRPVPIDGVQQGDDPDFLEVRVLAGVGAGCGQEVRVVAEEGPETVMLTARLVYVLNDEGESLCGAVGREARIPVQLREPVGDRDVVDTATSAQLQVDARSGQAPPGTA